MTTTWTAASTNIWGSTPGAASLNWSGGTTPGSTDDAVVNGTPGGDIVSPDNPNFMACHDIDFTGYNDQFLGADSIFHIYGDSIWSPGMSQANDRFRLLQFDNGSITSNGVGFYQITVDSGKSLTLLDDLLLHGNGNPVVVLNSGASLSQGDNDVVMELTNGGFASFAGSSWTYGPAATLTISGLGGACIFAGNLGSAPGASSPPLILLGSSTIRAEAYTKFESFDLTLFTGTFQMYNDGDFDRPSITTIGDMDFGSTATLILGEHPLFVCGGDFRANVDLNGGAAGAVFNVTGLAVLSGGAARTVTKCDFSGGSTLYADECIDGGGNTNVTFGPPPPPSSGDQQLPGVVAVIASL